MGWENVTLADTKVEKPAPVPVGDYVWVLQPGANYRPNPYTGVKELNVRFDVAEGEFAGRAVFVSYPDPETIDSKGKPMTWSIQALKKLEIVLGQDALPGEDTAQYLNRVALNGNARVKAPLILGKVYVDKNTGKERQEDPKFGIFNVEPAA